MRETQIDSALDEDAENMVFKNTRRGDSEEVGLRRSGSKHEFGRWIRRGKWACGVLSGCWGLNCIIENRALCEKEKGKRVSTKGGRIFIHYTVWCLTVMLPIWTKGLCTNAHSQVNITCARSCDEGTSSFFFPLTYKGRICRLLEENTEQVFQGKRVYED